MSDPRLKNIHLLKADPANASILASGVYLGRPGASGVYLGRPGVSLMGNYGNPWSHIPSKTTRIAKSKAEAVSNYRAWLLCDRRFVLVEPDRRIAIVMSLRSLAKKVFNENRCLLCFCVDAKGEGECHGRVLLELLDAYRNELLLCPTPSILGPMQDAVVKELSAASGLSDIKMKYVRPEDYKG